MPIYEYRCENGHLFEVMQKIARSAGDDLRDVRRAGPAGLPPDRGALQGLGLLQHRLRHVQAQARDGRVREVRRRQARRQEQGQEGLVEVLVLVVESDSSSAVLELVAAPPTERNTRGRAAESPPHARARHLLVFAGSTLALLACRGRPCCSSSRARSSRAAPPGWCPCSGVETGALIHVGGAAGRACRRSSASSPARVHGAALGRRGVPALARARRRCGARAVRAGAAAPASRACGCSATACWSTCSTRRRRCSSSPSCRASSTRRAGRSPSRSLLLGALLRRARGAHRRRLRARRGAAARRPARRPARGAAPAPGRTGCSACSRSSGAPECATIAGMHALTRRLRPRLPRRPAARADVAVPDPLDAARRLGRRAGDRRRDRGRRPALCRRRRGRRGAAADDRAAAA